jgi:uncharacterized protein YbbC (DUF1343 family)
MWTDTTVDTSSEVTIEALNLETSRVIILSQPLIQFFAAPVFSAHSVSMSLAIIIGMIDRQEFQVLLSAASTFSTVMLDNLCFDFLSIFS